MVQSKEHYRKLHVLLELPDTVNLVVFSGLAEIAPLAVQEWVLLGLGY